LLVHTCSRVGAKTVLVDGARLGRPWGCVKGGSTDPASSSPATPTAARRLCVQCEGKRNNPYLYRAAKDSGSLAPSIYREPEYQKRKTDISAQNKDDYSGSQENATNSLPSETRELESESLVEAVELEPDAPQTDDKEVVDLVD